MTTEHRAELQALMAQRPGDPELLTVDDVIATYLRRPAWHAHARCRGVGLDVFFIERGASSAPAKALCADCPVQGPCRAAALDMDAEAGIWAGETARNLRRGRSAA